MSFRILSSIVLPVTHKSLQGIVLSRWTKDSLTRERSESKPLFSLKAVDAVCVIIKLAVDARAVVLVHVYLKRFSPFLSG